MGDQKWLDLLDLWLQGDPPLSKNKFRLAIGSLDHMSPLKMDSTPGSVFKRPGMDETCRLRFRFFANFQAQPQLAIITNTLGSLIVVSWLSYLCLVFASLAGWMGRDPKILGGWSSFGVLVIFLKKIHDAHNRKGKVGSSVWFWSCNQVLEIRGLPLDFILDVWDFMIHPPGPRKSYISWWSSSQPSWSMCALVPTCLNTHGFPPPKKKTEKMQEVHSWGVICKDFMDQHFQRGTKLAT